MNYAQKTNVAFRQLDEQPSAVPSLDKDIFKHALDLKQPEYTDNLVHVIAPRLGIDTLSITNQRLFASRVIGGLSTRLALASRTLANQGRIDQGFSELGADDQLGVLHDMAVSYADAAEAKLDASNGEALDLFGADYANVGPLDAVSHQFVRTQLHTFKADQRTTADRMRDWISYVNVLPGTYPPGGFKGASIGSPDSLLVQAFGRNDVLDSELPVIRDMRASLGNEQAMMEYLDNRQFDPGDSNRALACAVDEQLHDGNVTEPIIQWEVAHALWQHNPEKFAQYAQHLHVLYPHSSFYPTYEVKADSVNVMDALGMYNPLELAHQDMAVRAMGILAHLGVQADLLAVDIPFDVHSKQFQTKGPVQWVLRETLTRVEHVLRGRINL